MKICHYRYRPPSGTRRAFFFLITIIVLFMIGGVRAHGQPDTYRKINSGTRADILHIQEVQNDLFFLTDKIYRLNRDSCRKLDLPVEGRIYTFFALSEDDIWFTLIPFSSTCLLYHYRNGVTENIRPPFSNYVTAIHFISPDYGLFASIADMAVYEKGIFHILPPSPARYNITRIFANDVAAFWILTEGGELFRYRQGTYERPLDQRKVNDFCFTDMQNGYLLSQDELFRVDGTGINLAFRDPGLLKMRKMAMQPDGTLLLVGERGLLGSYSGGRLTIYPALCDEDLSGLVTTDSNDTWIIGKSGRLLYGGAKQFPPYVEGNRGFSSHKLSSVGLSSDDEYGVAMADFSGDGRQDILTVRMYEQNRLYINKFESPDLSGELNGFSEEAVVRDATGAADPGGAPSRNNLKVGIGAADIDNDLDQDVYLCYLNGSNKLLLNRGNGFFRNVSGDKNRACGDLERSNAAVFSDVDNDGDLDLFATSEVGSNRLFENDGTGHFTDITATSGLGSAGGGMCASFADVNNDGLADLCVTFWYPSNKLYLNVGEKGRIRFRDITSLTALAKAAPSKSNAVAFADVNNDGFTDLFIANRNTGNKFYLNDGSGLFTDKTSEYFQSADFLSNGAVFADFDLDGFQDLYVTKVGDNVLYKNMNGRYFSDVTDKFGAEMSGYCTGCAAGDVDNDGDPDLYAASYINGNSTLFLNITEKKSFVKVKLRGVRSNRDAIGAKAWLYKVPGKATNGILAGYRELNGGGGYSSVSSKEMIFGVDPGTEYYLLVKFPSSSDTLKFEHIVAGKLLTVSELNGFSAVFTESMNYTGRFFSDQEKQPEIIKFLVVFLLMLLYNLRQRNDIRHLVLIRWLVTGFIFSVFAFVNQFFLFRWPSVTFFIAPLIAFILVAIEHLFIGRLLLRRLVQTEKLALREKLSRDLHDDLASTLGSISIYAETARALEAPSPADFKTLSGKIAGLTQTALESISDIIWMTSPQNDSLQSLCAKAGNYMMEVLTDNKINFRSDVEIPDEPVILTEKVRNDLFLILKEGLHNIISHASAGQATLSAGLTGNVCTICLADDGVGMDDTSPQRKGSHGHGLNNMRRRAMESGMSFSIHSQPGKGTEITLQFKI